MSETITSSLQVNEEVITATLEDHGETIIATLDTAPRGAIGPSAYDSYLATTEDDPPLSEAAWVASLGGGGGGTAITVEDGVASAPIGPGGALRYWYVYNDPPP